MYNNRLRSLWYKVKCWAWHRYSTVRPRTLPHTWVDRDHLMAHVLFEILGQFLEKEVGLDGLADWYSQKDSREALIEMQGHWMWWQEEFLTFDTASNVESPTLKQNGSVLTLEYKDENHRRAFELQSKLSYAAELAMEDELNRRLKRIIDLREWMWT